MKLMEFTVDLINKQNEVIGKDIHEDVEAKITIDVHRIVSFRETYSDESDESLGKEVIVYLEGGENFHLNISYKDFALAISK